MSTEDNDPCFCAHCIERRELKEALAEARQVLIELYGTMGSQSVEMSGRTSITLRRITPELWGRWMKVIEEA